MKRSLGNFGRVFLGLVLVLGLVLGLGLGLGLGLVGVMVAGCGTTTTTPDSAAQADLTAPAADMAMAVGDMAMAAGDMATAAGDMALAAGDMAMAAPDLAMAAGKTVDVMVGQGGLNFSPQNVTIKVGDTIHWVWASNNHTVTSGANGTADTKFCSPNNMNCAAAATSNAGATYDFKFSQAGAYPYFCRPHFGGGMTGTITVQ